jgi:integrase
MAKKARKPKTLPYIPLELHAAKLLAAAGSGRDGTILLIATLTGLRVSEISNLTVRDVELDTSRLWVREGKGDKDRCLPVPQLLKARLAEWIGDRGPSDPLFPSPRGGALKPRAIQIMIKRQAARAGLPKSELGKITPHKLRHYFATGLIEANVPIHEVSALMGHSSIQTTQVYLHVNTNRLQGAIDKLRMPKLPPVQGTLFD